LQSAEPAECRLNRALFSRWLRRNLGCRGRHHVPLSARTCGIAGRQGGHCSIFKHVDRRSCGKAAVKMGPRLKWLPITLLALGLAAILGFLYIKTRDYDSSRYHETVALLRQLKQLDARWELDVLRSRMGIERDYDSLVDPLVSLTQLWSRLQSMVTDQPA